VTRSYLSAPRCAAPSGLTGLPDNCSPRGLSRNKPPRGSSEANRLAPRGLHRPLGAKGRRWTGIPGLPTARLVALALPLAATMCMPMVPDATAAPLASPAGTAATTAPRLPAGAPPHVAGAVFAPLIASVVGAQHGLFALGHNRFLRPAGVQRSRGTGPWPAIPNAYLGDFVVTCYDLTGRTASGAMAGPESVAVDPRVIPLGTQIFISGVGDRTADDTGGAIVGDHIDIWEPTFTACADWGVEEKAVFRASD